jgi:2-haloacid dehalogenase
MPPQRIRGLEMTPSAVVLDVNETLFSLSSLESVFDDLGLTGKMPLWFARTLRNGFALTTSGTYRSFPDVARGALRSLDPDRICDEDADALMQAFAHLRPHADVEAGLQRLHEAGLRCVTLSVGNATNVEKLFERAGLNEFVQQHLSCEAVSRWKPDPQPYLYACGQLGSPPKETFMVAAHAWDLAGAKGVGMRTAWLSRLERVFDVNFGQPDLVGNDFVDVVDNILSL